MIEIKQPLKKELMAGIEWHGDQAGRLVSENRNIRIGVAVSRFNDEVTSRLLQGAKQVFETSGSDHDVFWVPGAFELSTMAGVLVQRDYDAVLCLGAVIRGETLHFDYIAHAVARSLADLGIRHGKPVLFGVLTTDTVEQAMERSGGGQGNRGADAASGALEMVNLLRQPKND